MTLDLPICGDRYGAEYSDRWPKGAPPSDEDHSARKPRSISPLVGFYRPANWVMQKPKLYGGVTMMPELRPADSRERPAILASRNRRETDVAGGTAKPDRWWQCQNRTARLSIYPAAPQGSHLPDPWNTVHITRFHSTHCCRVSFRLGVCRTASKPSADIVLWATGACTFRRVAGNGTCQTGILCLQVPHFDV